MNKFQVSKAFFSLYNLSILCFVFTPLTDFDACHHLCLPFGLVITDCMKHTTFRNCWQRFSCCCNWLWDSLSRHGTSSSSLEAFRCRLKTH